jgi:hypothetical protein
MESEISMVVATTAIFELHLYNYIRSVLETIFDRYEKPKTILKGYLSHRGT